MLSLLRSPCLLLVAALSLACDRPGGDDAGPAPHPVVARAAQQLAGGDYDDAIGTLQEALRAPSALAASDLGHLHRQLARAHLAVGHLDSARHHLRAALRLRPDDPDVHEVSGAVFAARAIGVPDRAAADSAIGAYRRALALDPTRSLAHYNLAMIYAHLDSGGHVERSLRAAVEADADFAAAHKKLGAFYRKMGDMERARGHLERALSQLPDDAEVRFQLGLVLRALGEDPAALAHLEKAAEGNPTSPQVFYALGTLYMRLGRRAEGQRALQTSEILRLNNRGDRSEIVPPGPGALAASTASWPSTMLCGGSWTRPSSGSATPWPSSPICTSRTARWASCWPCAAISPLPRTASSGPSPSTPPTP
jgi:tetratricopeptide (TPR) repeat protein